MSDMYRYHSICNVKKMRGSALPKLAFISEKIHGANFSFILTKNGIKVASRNQQLGDLDNITFFNSGDLIREKVNKLLDSNLYKYFLLDKDISRIIIYGELYGDKVFKNTGYNKTSDFIAFDMLVFKWYINDNNDLDESFFFVEYPFLKDSLNGVLDVIEPIEIGDMATLAKKYSEECNFEVDRFLEGFVVKEYSARSYYASVFKIISPKFSGRKNGNSKPPVDYVYNELNDEYLKLIDVSRVESAISKLGENVGFNELLTEVLEDADKDFIENGFEIENRKTFYKPMMNIILPIVRETWLNNCWHK